VFWQKRISRCDTFTGRENHRKMLGVNNVNLKFPWEWVSRDATQTDIMRVLQQN